jgi:hypothetical protein
MRFLLVQNYQPNFQARKIVCPEKNENRGFAVGPGVKYLALSGAILRTDRIPAHRVQCIEDAYNAPLKWRRSGE